jgi:hypothetical protein
MRRPGCERNCNDRTARPSPERSGPTAAEVRPASSRHPSPEGADRQAFAQVGQGPARTGWTTTWDRIHGSLSGLVTGR